MRLFKYIFQHKVALLGIVALLLVQAYCDLSLPNYTSDIVDVGIQQKGIEHAALTDMRSQTYDYLYLLVDPDQRDTFAQSYDRDADGTYHLNAAGQADIDALDGIEALPLTLLSYAAGADASQLAQMQQMAASGHLTDEQIATIKDQLSKKLGSMEGTIVTQRAISYDATEYEALGMDLNAIQMNYLFREGALMIGLTLLMAVAAALIGLIASRASAEIGRSLRERLFAKVMSFSHAEIGKFSAASLITRSTNDIQQIQLVSVFLMRMVLYAPILGVGGIIMAWGNNANMTWIIALAVLLIIGGVGVLLALTMPKFRIMQSLIDKVNLVAREILTGVSVIRAFRREHFEQARFEDASRTLMKTQLFTNRVMIAMQPLLMIVMNAASVLIVWTAGQQIDMGAMQVGNMIAFITYSMIIIMAFLMLSMVAIMLPRAAVAAGRVDEVLDTKVSIADPENPVDFAQVERAAGEQAGTIEFDHVSFRYGDAAENRLTDISFTARPGTTTAVVGSTGSGKSTLLNLIPRFYDATEGAVRIDGVDVRDLRQSDLRGCMGYVPQKGVLFSGTIESNLKFAGPQVDDARMEKAARIAQASDFISEKDQGFASPISQGGTNVSGGQKQRLGIARALASDAQILLFDDSFSALDYKTDTKLRAALAAENRHATVVIVAQRIATVLHADQILVLDEGRLVGAGTHEELLATCPTYREIAESQLSQSELEEGGAQ